ncbi:MAG: GNVR domain-containing protein, partial [Desulfobacterales bacterium]
IQVKIGRENQTVPPGPSSGNNPVSDLNREKQLNSEIEILTSPSLTLEVVKALGPGTIYPNLGEQPKGALANQKPESTTQTSLAQEAVLKLVKNLEVKAVKKSNVIQFSYKNKDPQVAASVLNSLVSLFLDRHLAVYKNPKSYAFFEEQSRILRNQLTGSEKRLEDFKKTHDLDSLEEQRNHLREEHSKRHTDLSQTENQIVETRNRLEQLRPQLAKVPRNVPQSETIDHNPSVINSLQATLVELELKQDELLNKYTEQSRLVQNVKDEIAMVHKKLDTQEEKRYGKSSSGVNTTYQRLLGQLRAQLGKAPQTIPTDEEVDHNPDLINSLQERLVALELKEKELINKYAEQNRLLQDVKGEIAMVRRKLDIQEEKRYGKTGSEVNTTYQRIEGEVFKNEVELKALVAKQKTLNEQLAPYQDQLDKINRIEMDLSQLEQEVEVDRQSYRLHLIEFDESRSSNAMDSGKITNASLLESAHAPLRPVSPNKLRNLILGFLLGAFGGLGLAFFREFLDDRLERPEQVENALKLPVLASIPKFKS